MGATRSGERTRPQQLGESHRVCHHLSPACPNANFPTPLKASPTHQVPSLSAWGRGGLGLVVIRRRFLPEAAPGSRHRLCRHRSRCSDECRRGRQNWAAPTGSEGGLVGPLASPRCWQRPIWIFCSAASAQDVVRNRATRYPNASAAQHIWRFREGESGAREQNRQNGGAPNRVLVPPLCDYCGSPADDQPVCRVVTADREAWLHRRCEAPWLNGSGR